MGESRSYNPKTEITLKKCHHKRKSSFSSLFLKVFFFGGGGGGREATTFHQAEINLHKTHGL